MVRQMQEPSGYAPGQNRSGKDDAGVVIRVDGLLLSCQSGTSVAGALLAHGIYRLRRSPAARTPRGPFCMMGACQECAVLIDGRLAQACQVEVGEGMEVELRGAGDD